MLRRMADRGELKCQEVTGAHDLFMLSTTRKFNGVDKYAHQLAGADLFVTYSSHCSAWIYEPPVLNDRADRGMKIFGKTIYFEVDRCNEGLPKIKNKIENYVRYAHETGRRFHVVFSILGTKEEDGS